MDGHQLDGRDAEPFQVLNHGLGCQTAIGAAQLFGNVGMTFGEALDVELVDHRVAERNAEVAILFPVEVGIHHHAFLHARSVVVFIERQILVRMARLIGKNRRVPIHLACERLGIRIDHQLVRIEAQALVRLIRTVHAIAIELPGQNPLQIAVPHICRSLRQSQTRSCRTIHRSKRQSSTHSAFSE